MIKRLRRRLDAELLSRRYARLHERYRNHTMVPRMTFAANLQLARMCSSVTGCVVECGVWRGGMIAAFGEILGNGREYYLFDSFEGLPEAKAIDGIAALAWQKNTSGPDYHDNCRAEESYAREALALAGIQSANIVPGWFKDTLSHFPDKPVALLRLDADWYDSTMECLVALYPKVTPGGLVIIDDYYTWDGCARAVHQYLAAHGIADRIRCTSEGVCFLRKEERADTSATDAVAGERR